MDINSIGGVAAPLTSRAVRVDLPGGATASDSGGAGTVRDRLTLSPDAQAILDGGPALLKIDPEEMRRNAETMRLGAIAGMNSAQADYEKRFKSFVRDKLGLDKDVDVTLKGDILKTFKALAKKVGIEEPPSLNGGDKAEDDSETASEITLDFPKSKGGGSVSILVDNVAFLGLADASPSDAAKGLADLKRPTGRGVEMQQATADGVLGDYMSRHRLDHPDWSVPKAQYGFAAPEADASPAILVQSQDRPEYVQAHAADIVRSLLRVAKEANP